jgi:hypothetical protein
MGFGTVSPVLWVVTVSNYGSLQGTSISKVLYEIFLEE